MDIIITKEKWQDYRKCQQLGYFNMFDYMSYVRHRLTKLTEKEWIEIIKNYSKYAEQYGK